MASDDYGTFQCSSCGRQLPRVMPEEHALALLQADFPGITADDCAMVCTSCFERCNASGLFAAAEPPPPAKRLLN